MRRRVKPVQTPENVARLNGQWAMPNGKCRKRRSRRRPRYLRFTACDATSCADKLTPMASLGLLQRKEIWVPTLKGWLVLLAGLAAVAGAALVWTVPFLAP